MKSIQKREILYVMFIEKLRMQHILEIQRKVSIAKTAEKDDWQHMK